MEKPRPQFSNSLKNFANFVARALIYAYRATFSPSVGIFRILPGYPKPSCVFYPTCSAYALVCFEKYPFRIALSKILHRIHRCRPSTDPTVDMP